jgi:glyoxylase I family protein
MAMLHHMSLPVRDLDASRAFYRDVISLSELPRPGFSSPGAWFAVADRQMHLAVNAKGTFRQRPFVDPIDVHHAYRVADFEASIGRIASLGFRVVPFKGAGIDRDDDDLMCLCVDRRSPAGYLQAFLLDPDWHIVELNDAGNP